MIHEPTVCLYHFPCLDGFTAAWAVWRKYGPSVRYIPANYGEPLPAKAFAGEHVLMVDFSYKPPMLERLIRDCASITILDHHKSAQEDLTRYLEDGRIQGKFEMEKSGASMAWEWCFNTVARPLLIMFVEDYDLWRFNCPETRAIKAALTSYDYDFATWSELAARVEQYDTQHELLREGEAIDRAQAKCIREMVRQATQQVRIGGFMVPCCNLPYMWASDGAGALAEHAPFAASYYDQRDKRVFSLRSRPGEHSVDVADIARLYGGGGHQHAAGFQTPLGWLGDRG